ncbi:MAG TPA: hypothetical protein VFA26_07905 [Gemmataceae bacterium]|nr:hypothetical protein [Gemmataceae bacterium]
MRDFDEPYFPPHAVPRQPGVAPFWRVLALLSFVLAAGLLAGVFVLAFALIVEREQSQLNRIAITPPQVQANAPPDGGDDPADDPEPPNPPYPTEQDLAPPGPPKLPGEEPRPDGTARRRFLQISQEAWANPLRHFPQHVSVSPDGRQVAYNWTGQLFVGPINGNPEVVADNGPAGGFGGGLGGMAGVPGGGGRRGPGAAPGRQNGLRITGNPAWSADGGAVYFTDTEGRLRRYDTRFRQVHDMPFRGDLAAPALTDLQMVFRRSRPALKVEGPDGQVPPDPTEIVFGNVGTGAIRVLVPENTAQWHHAAVSPDGKRVALVTERGPADRRGPRMRILLVDLAGGAPKPMGPPLPWVAAVSWAPDGRGLVYCRRQENAPPDCWEREAPGIYRDPSDIFYLDVATGQETRLSRGGGFLSCGVANDGTLFFLFNDGLGRGGPVLRRVSLADARAFASREVDLPPRTLKDWTALAEQALKGADLKADVSGADLTPEALARLLDAYRGEYRKRFRQDPPATLAALEAQRNELAALNALKRKNTPLALVLGAVEGDYLARKHNAVWKLSAGPLYRPVAAAEARSPFGLAVNPFAPEGIFPGRPADPEDEDDDLPPVALRNWLFAAEGRPLVLTNDPDGAKATLAELADPALAQAEQLLKGKQNLEKADELLLELMQQPRHRANRHLLLHVGRLLAEHQRWAALRRLMEPACQDGPPDARKHNLLGLAVLANDPQGSVKHFQAALRCDLRYAPGYLNLARAYQQAGNPQDAALCLRRLVKMVPFGPHAADARQRLAALQPGAAPPPAGPGAPW